MAKLYQEPRTNQCDLTDWGKLTAKTTFVAGGYIAATLTSDARAVQVGSRIEINGSLYFVEGSNDSINDWTKFSNGTNLYIYAIPSSGGTASFSYRTTAPMYNADKSGWYDGTDRAIFILYKNALGFGVNASLITGNVMPNPNPIPFVESFAVSNIDNTNAPQVVAGSKFILNGKVVNITSATNVSGTPSPDKFNYVYAVASGDTAVFSYGATTPAYSPSKGGWYNGNNRAIAKFYYVDGNYNGKVVLDSHSSFI